MSNFDPVPWLVEGGAKHSANVARNVAFAAFGGSEGIVSARDLEVRELAAPGAAVRVFPGTVAILNRSAGTRDEMYVGRLPVEDQVNVAATDATGGRSDLIAVQVKNPHLGDAAFTAYDPLAPAFGPYVETVVIPGVASTATSVDDLPVEYADASLVPLARIDLPASTSTVTQAMVTDLRFMSGAKSRRESRVISPSLTENLTASFAAWPSEVAFDVAVPSWATRAQVRAILGGVRIGAVGNNGGLGWEVRGDVRVKIGANAGQAADFNFSNEGGFDMTTLMAGAPSLPVAGLQDTTVTVAVEGRTTFTNGADVISGPAAMCSLEVEFTEEPESNL